MATETKSYPELFRKVEGFDGLWVSNLGRVMSYAQNKEGKKEWKYVEQRMGRGRDNRVVPVVWTDDLIEYKRVRHYVTGKGRFVRSGGLLKKCLVNELVAKAFLGPQPEGTTIEHRNGDRLDNRLTNLFYKPKQNRISDKDEKPRQEARRVEQASRRTKAENAIMEKWKNIDINKWL